MKKLMPARIVKKRNGRSTYDRIGRGTLEIESACLSILDGIQPGALQAYLA